MSNYKIQYIAYEIDRNFEDDGITLSRLDEPQSLDEFNVNVIDISSHAIWTQKKFSIDQPDYIDEFDAINIMMQHSQNTNNVIILPQNCDYKFNNFKDKTDIKRLIGYNFEYWVSHIAMLPENILIYENTTTQINGICYSAAFHFNNDFIGTSNNVFSKSKTSNKNTTIKYNDVYFTTLNICNSQQLINFLSQIKLIELKEQIPAWVTELNLFDDIEQKSLIYDKEEIIRECDKAISNANDILERNNRFKSILYTNGEELVTVIFEMIEKMFNYDLSEFKDEKKEDFLIQLENVTFIGEIKGVTSNIKSEHISQLEVHYQEYLDKLVEESKNENVKAILIMDHQRTQNISNRQPVHINQIKLAERNESLIIETSTLLKIFEKYLCDTISSEEVIELFTTRRGLLEL